MDNNMLNDISPRDINYYKGGGANNPDATTVIDNQLLARIKDGDHDAFKQLYYRWEEPLHKFLTRLIGSSEDAADICQDTFTDLWMGREAIDLRKNSKALIYLVARRKVWNYKRHLRVVDEYSGSLDDDPVSDVSPDSLILANEIRLITEYVLGTLPARTSEIYRLHSLDNLSYGEIARRFDINENNVRSHMHMARKKIREALSLALILFFP
ncbi:RNA polymerase sigma factor [Alistipes sp. OttesenSCG-928-L06]|nr:RNA polymerase sigma factor [Alistipes sp. OttesenSCG-928-L06]